MMTWESTQVQGVPNIIQKLKSPGRIHHDVKSLDVQPSIDQSAILIFVTGHMSIDQGNPLQYAEVFHLVSSSGNAYTIHNIMFRLIYG